MSEIRSKIFSVTSSRGYGEHRATIVGFGCWINEPSELKPVKK